MFKKVGKIFYEIYIGSLQIVTAKSYMEIISLWVPFVDFYYVFAGAVEASLDILKLSLINQYNKTIFLLLKLGLII